MKSIDDGMGIAEQSAVCLHRLCRVMVKEEIDRIVIAADVQTDGMAALAGARRFPDSFNKVPVFIPDGLIWITGQFKL